MILALVERCAVIIIPQLSACLMGARLLVLKILMEQKERMIAGLEVMLNLAHAGERGGEGIWNGM